jgi:hypothetical protein
MRLFASRLHGYRELTYQELLGERYAIVGSPDTVLERLTELNDEVGAGIVVGAGGRVGSMPHSMVMRSTELIAEEVMPHFRQDQPPAYSNGAGSSADALNGSGVKQALPRLNLVGEPRRPRQDLPSHAPAIASFTATGLARHRGNRRA